MSVPKFRQNISKFSVTSTALAPEPALHYFGPFRLSENERLLFCGDTEVRLKTKDLDVLLVLLKNRSRLVTKAELMEEVWPNSYVAEANLGVHIACLRKALRKHAPRHRYIETVHKYGYRFVETVIEEREELAVEVFLKWWRNPSAYGEQAEGWLYRASVRKALDELRSQTRRNRFEQLLGMGRERPPTPEQLYALSAEQRRVRTVLAALKGRDAEILLLRGQELSYQEIAAALKLNPNSVGSLVSRAQEAFRKEYLKRYGTE